MNRKVISAFVAALALGASTAVFAADQEAKPGQGMHQHGMHGGQAMMSGCPMMSGGMMGGMMGRGMMGGGMMPQLPPGNEKLQLQMWGEMTQKMGEIASKYAAQVK